MSPLSRTWNDTVLAIHKKESARLVAREVVRFGLRATPGGECLTLLAGKARGELNELCFAPAVLMEPQSLVIKGGIAQALADTFCEVSHRTKFEGPWTLAVWSQQESGLSRNPKLEDAVRDGIRRAMSRVARLATTEEPAGAVAKGFFVALDPDGAVYWSRECWCGGQRRMRDDPRAPSRSYLKCEEAFRVLGREPSVGERVADLGAAPGGWSYSAAKRGARVTAVDHGALKGSAAEHPDIEYACGDAFLFRPERGDRFDWLLCDMVESPTRVLAQIEKWVTNRWCRWFVVNLKCGRADPVAMVESLYDTSGPVRKHCDRLLCRELFHDRDEITMVGHVA